MAEDSIDKLKQERLCSFTKLFHHEHSQSSRNVFGSLQTGKETQLVMKFLERNLMWTETQLVMKFLERNLMWTETGLQQLS